MQFKPDNLGSAHWLDPKLAGSKYAYIDGAPMIFLGRNPVDHSQAMGFKSDNHIFLCAGTRAMKGRSIIINNLTKWPGSIVAVDPKGENATICAERRGKGNAFCEGMGQDVYVLDPFGCAQVPDEYRAFYNPMDAIDADDDDLLNSCFEMALSMCIIQENAGESADWVKAGADLIGVVIAHVKTSPDIADEDRNLATVAKYCRGGNVQEVWEALEYNDNELKNAEKEVREPVLVKVPDSVNALLWEIARNKSFDGMIAECAINYIELRKKGDRHFASILQSAYRETKFLSSRNMKARVTGCGKVKRSLNIDDLKDSDKAVSVFLCLPENKFESSGRWEKLMASLILNRMQKRQGLPRTGIKLLMCLDEFLSLGKVEPILKGMNSIAGAGVQMMICVTNINGMERLYGKTWQEFLSGCTLQIFFKIDDLAGKEFLEKMLGETEVNKFGRSFTDTVNEQTTMGFGLGFSETNTLGTSHTDSTNFSTANTHAEGQNWTESKGIAKTKTSGKAYSFNSSLNYGESHGTQAGEGYGPHLFFRPWKHTSHTGTNHSRNTGGQTGQGRTDNTGASLSRNTQSGKGGNVTDSTTDTTGGGTSDTTNESHAKTNSVNVNFATAKGSAQANGGAETFHKRALMTIPEIDEYLGIKDEDRADPAYPGLALVKISGVAPMLVRKCYYDDDPLFHRAFNPNPEYTFIPWYMKPLLECEYTESHYLMLRLPDSFVGQKIEVIPMLANGGAFNKGEAIFSYRAENDEKEWVVPACEGKVIEFVPEDVRVDTGELALLRFDTPLSDDERAAITQDLLRPLWEKQRAQEKLAADLAAAEAEKHAREKRAQEEAAQFEAEQKEREALYAWHQYANECHVWKSQFWRMIYDPIAVGLGWAFGTCVVISVLAGLMGFDFEYHGRLPYLCNFFGFIAFFFGTWLGAKERGNDKEALNSKLYTLRQKYGSCPPSLNCNGV